MSRKILLSAVFLVIGFSSCGSQGHQKITQLHHSGNIGTTEEKNECTTTVNSTSTITSAVSSAASGAHICVTNGSYGTMNWSGGGSRTTKAIVEPAPGATVSFTGTLKEYASNVEVKNISMAGQLWEIEGAMKNVQMTNVAARHFYIESAGASRPENITVKGGSYGPNHSYPDNLVASDGSKLSPKNILIENVEFHDQTRNYETGDVTHFECLQVWAAEGLTIKGSTFTKCSIFDVFIQRVEAEASIQPPAPSGIKIENNTFDCCSEYEPIKEEEVAPSAGFSYTIEMATSHNEGKWAGVTIQNNTMDAPIIFNNDSDEADAGGPITFSGVNVENNIMPKLVMNENGEAWTSKALGENHGFHENYNMFLESAAISAKDIGTTEASKVFEEYKTGGYPGTAKASQTSATRNLKLKSTSPAINKGDPLFFAAEDKAGISRNRSVFPDQGAYEYTPGTKLFLAANGSDSNSCTEGSPCKSFEKAYEKAECGETVQVAEGTYNTEWTGPGSEKLKGERIPYNETKSKCTADVVFTPAPGAKVSIVKGGSIRDLGSHVVFQNMYIGESNEKGNVETMGFELSGSGPGHAVEYVAFQNMIARNFEPAATHNLSIDGGSYGPASCAGSAKPELTQYGGGNNALRVQTTAAFENLENVFIDNLTIHNIYSYKLAGAGECHTEGLAIFDGSNITVANDKFYKNDVFDILAQANSGAPALGQINLVNNWFGFPTETAGTGSGDWAVTFDTGKEFLVANNSWNGPFLIEASPPFSNAKYIGNIGFAPVYSSGSSGSMCGASGATAEYNLTKTQSGLTCTTATNTSLGAEAFPYVNTSSGEEQNYHLANESTKAQKYVPLANQFVITDIDGSLRPGELGGSAINAGSDELP